MRPNIYVMPFQIEPYSHSRHPAMDHQNCNRNENFSLLDSIRLFLSLSCYLTLAIYLCNAMQCTITMNSVFKWRKITARSLQIADMFFLLFHFSNIFYLISPTICSHISTTCTHACTHKFNF